MEWEEKSRRMSDEPSQQPSEGNSDNHSVDEHEERSEPKSHEGYWGLSLGEGSSSDISTLQFLDFRKMSFLTKFIKNFREKSSFSSSIICPKKCTSTFSRTNLAGPSILVSRTISKEESLSIDKNLIQIVSQPDTTTTNSSIMSQDESQESAILREKQIKNYRRDKKILSHRIDNSILERSF